MGELIDSLFESIPLNIKKKHVIASSDIMKVFRKPSDMAIEG